MGLRPAPATIARRSYRTQRWLSRLRGGLIAAVIAMPAALPACTGFIGDPPPDGIIPPDAPILQVADRSRFPRLSHKQWENTVRDLLRLDQQPGLSASFTGDPLGGVFDNNELSLQVTPGLWADYQRAAEELASLVVSDSEKLAKILPADLPEEPTARARAFIEAFGKRAFRRPLAAAEIDEYAALYAKGSEILKGQDAFNDGMTLVLQGFLQSPHFVYRVERSETPRDEDGLIPLSGYELATKLSYLLWNTMPDDQLLDAAAAGELDTAEGVRGHAKVMLDDPKARDAIASFHSQLYNYDHYLDLFKDQGLFPEFTAEVGSDMQREAELFVDSIVFEKEGSLTDLLTAPTTWVNDRLAKIYGLEGDYTADFKEAQLDPTKRSGFLTHLGFLASNGTARQPDTIHRGVFVNLRVLCATLPPPPDNATGIPPGEEKTNRERVNAHTGEGTCGASCHGTLINPIGFAFENYDAIGKYRTEDNGFPVNAASAYVFAGESQSYADAVELSKIIAENDQAHRCYAKHWLEFAYGRSTTKADKILLDRLGDESRGGLPVKELILELVEADAFLTRAPVEAQ